MDASAVERYRYLLAALAAALVLGLLVAAYLARRSSPLPPGGVEPGPSGARHVLPPVMLMLVAMVAITGIVLLLPVAMVVQYFPGAPVTILVLSTVLLLSGPLLYAWRSRSL